MNWRAIIDMCYRHAYRIAYPIATIWWRIIGHNGVSVIVWFDGRILAVHHSYRRGLELPTGGVEAGESYRSAAARELAEETGVVLDENDLTYIMTTPSRYGERQVYEAHLKVEPLLKIDMREIVHAGFHSPDEVTDKNLHLVSYLRLPRKGLA